MKIYLLFPMLMMICSLSYSQVSFTTNKCKNATNERVKKACIIKEIQNYVEANFDIAAVSSFAQSGTNRIYTRFTIGSDGKISDIQSKASALELELEAHKVLKSFDGLIVDYRATSANTIDNTFTLPIVFNVEKTEITLTASRVVNN